MIGILSAQIREPLLLQFTMEKLIVGQAHLVEVWITFAAYIRDVQSHMADIASRLLVVALIGQGPLGTVLVMVKLTLVQPLVLRVLVQVAPRLLHQARVSLFLRLLVP
jgi:hypothetical protein